MDDIRFAHYRVFDNGTNRILSNGGVTLAVGRTDDGRYRVAGAKCHEVDHYCKQNGRTKSKGRLFCKHSFKLEKVNINGKSQIVRKTNWVESDEKPSLDSLQVIAESMYQHRQKNLNYDLVNSGVWFKNNKC